ncbi:hypothetical protein [Propionivibrio soli]|uniref:hypothetical protein n=1 Tax=Propionivibrio soli TaxID=2976531 RepID=UPI0021E8E1C3|nr:hypothetical protein [Propionivibrio soli]
MIFKFDCLGGEHGETVYDIGSRAMSWPALNHEGADAEAMDSQGNSLGEVRRRGV